MTKHARSCKLLCHLKMPWYDTFCFYVFHYVFAICCKISMFQTSSEAPHLDEYLEYIDHEISKGDPQRVLCLFERAIQDNCLNADLWIKYTKYLVGDSKTVSAWHAGCFIAGFDLESQEPSAGDV